ncbi:GIGYF family protein Gyf [Anopheles bellator]|uniref:GIGYF family protein Gyf n=1 Tax=Anopheles bellator TaxID=139047 RepID=UPI00264A3733|nr:GIGYF family protein Gyf [Anopheles bellator]
MGDAINFGPAWLRKVAFDSNTNSSNNSNHQNNTSGSHSNSSGQSMNNSSSSSSSGGSASINTSNTITTLVNNSGGGGGVGLHHQQHHSNHQHSQHHHGLSGAGTAAANNGAPTTRYALAEFRYGREEMLALFDSKTLKGPEILVNYKHLYVEKVQPPLALTPCPEEELATEPDSRRIWQSRSISMGIPSRGGGRGVSVDRGRGRGRGAYTSYTRSTSFYDDESRGAGRGERPWLERNGSAGGSGALGGGGGIGDIEWNSSSSSPRKDYGSRIRSSAGGTTESWRRSRTDDDNTSNGIGGGGDWRSGGSGSLASGRDKWSRSTSWRDEDSSSHGLLERSLNSSSERMISVPAYKSRLSGAGHGGNELLNSSASGGHSSGPDKRRPHYDADELPEWATENPCDFGGSFDATGAFHDSDNDTEGANTAGGGGGRFDASDSGSSSVKPASQKTKDSERSKPPAERRLGESGMLVGSGTVRDDAATSSTSASSSLSSASGAKSSGAEYGNDKDRTIDDEETMNHSANKELEGLQSDNNGSQTAFTPSSTVNSKTGSSMERESREKDSTTKRDSQDERPSGVVATSEVSSSVKGRSASCESIESAVSEPVALSTPAWGKTNELPSGANDGGSTVTERGNGDNASQAAGKSQPASLPLSTENEPKKSPSSTSVDRMQEVADDMVAQLIMDDEFLVTDGDPSVSGLGGPSAASAARHAGLEKSPVFGMSSVSGQVSAAAAMGMAGSVRATGGLPLNMVLPKSPMPMQPILNHNVHRVNALLMSDVSSRVHVGGGSGAGGAVAPGISQLHHLMTTPAPGTDVWYYRDPQGKVQGPFPASEMTEWYRAGYFDDSLSVRRACDEVYTTLGTLVALCGGSIPFLNSMTIPPIKTSGGTNGTSGIKQSSQQQQTSQQQPGPGTQIQPKAAGGNVSGVVQPSPVNQQQPSIGGPQTGQPQPSALHTSGQGGVSSAAVGGMPAPPTEQELQQMKRLHVIRQHSLLIQKLHNSEGWHLLSPEQQNAIITQQMNQLVSVDGMLMSPSLPGHQQQSSVGPSPGSSIFSGGPSIPQQAGQDVLVNLKLRDIPPHPQQQPQSSQLPLLEQLQKSGNHQHNNFLKLHMPEFVQPQQVAGARPMMNILNADSAAAVTGGHDPLGQLMHGINFNQQPPVQNLGPLGPPNLMMNRGGLAMHQQPTPQSQQSHPAGKPTVDNDPIQSLFMQLSMNKNQQHPQLTPHQQQSSKAAAELITPWLHTTAGQQQSQPPTSGGASGGGGGMPGVMPCSSASVPGAAGPAWGDLPPPPTSASFASLMQQQQSQSHLPVAGHPLLMNSGGPSNEPQAPSVASLFKHHQQVEKQQQLEKEQLLQHQQHFVQLQQHQQQQLQSESEVLAQQKQQLQQQPHPSQHLQDQHQLLHQQQLQHLQQQQQLQQLQQQQLPHPEEERFNQKPQTKEEQKKELMGGQQPPHGGSIGKKQNNKQLNHVDVDEKATSDSSLSGQQQPTQPKAKKPSKSNNHTHGGGSSNSNGHNNLVNENETEFICVKKEMEEKKRLKELKKLQQEEQKRKLVEEKKRQEEQDAQKKAKLLESQRREAIKIQEQQQQQQQQPSHQQVARAASKPAPWSAAVAEVATSGLSLAEIQKAERERRALLARQEQTMREQQEQQQLLVLQAQLDSKLKWDAHLVPANVKPLAEIQAEEAAAAERAREKNFNVSGLTVAAITAQPAKVGKKDETLTLGTAVWQGQSGSSLLYWNSGKPWGAEGSNETTSSFATGNAMSNNISSGGFWEEPTQPTPAVAVGKGGNHARKTQTHGSTTSVAAPGKQQQQQQQQQFLSKSKTMGSISTPSTSTVNAARQQQQKQQQSGGLVKGGSSAAGGVGGGAKTGKTSNAWGNAADRKEDRKNQNEQNNEFTSWCSRALSSLNSNVDIPTFVGFLQDIESPYEVKEYIRVYLGETKECSEFSKQFLERRSKYKNQQRQKNAHIDDMCKPAPAINPSSNDFQEIKGKGKKIKKNKMTKLDNRILGFSVTAAPDRLNVGDRDYGDNA